MARNTYRLSYTGNNGGSTDWKIDVDYAKMNEDDITLTSYYGKSPYEGKNTLAYLDDVIHKQLDIKASANTQINDRHLLTYGLGYTRETGKGSRLKSAPQTYTRYINPWDYDKNLYSKGGKGEPASRIHDYLLFTNSKGIPYYDEAYELYGIRDEAGNSLKPPYTWEDYLEYGPYAQGSNVPAEAMARWKEFTRLLREENMHDGGERTRVLHYYTQSSIYTKEPITYKGHSFKEEYAKRKNRQTIGEAEIKKEHFFVQDTWQLNQNTTLTPILRLDHSSLFGTTLTFNLGMTHMLRGKPSWRLKANVGTGYAEPGMGELYYNWEMYAGMPVGFDLGKLGYYWAGNPRLRPEKSLNLDIGVERETAATMTRLNLFHNRIRDYMTTYFTGYLMDFNPSISDEWKWVVPPDMIYSFKNIGKAEITGLEAQVEHRFNDHWSGKLGYTYLHAVNKSDPDMPRQLLDKPQHKVDVGITYENKKGGWRASLWGNYYIRMLDSRTVANNGNYIDYDGTKAGYHFAEGGKQTYEKKTFGLWNILVQKDLSKDAMVYFGIDNLFNHHDDDRALQERVYKLGVNMKFGGAEDGRSGAAHAGTKHSAAAEERSPAGWFITPPFEEQKERGIRLLGSYRGRWNSHGGADRAAARVTSVAAVGTAEKNMFDRPAHGFEQRLQLGIDARLDDRTNVTVLGSASGMTGVDTRHDISDSKGLNHQGLDKADITRHVKKWDFSVGRLTEPLGVTGYWFGKEYDGGRAVWTSGKNQVRVGYGGFGRSTGISDSAYTHATRQLFYRAPTKDEWLWDTNVDEYISLKEKMDQAGSLEEQLQLGRQYLEVIKAQDRKTYEKLISTGGWNQIFPWAPDAWYRARVFDEKTGAFVGEYIVKHNTMYSYFEAHNWDELFNTDFLRRNGEIMWNQLYPFAEGHLTDGFSRSDVSGRVELDFLFYGEYTGSQEPGGYYGSYQIGFRPDQLDLTRDFTRFTREEEGRRSLDALVKYWMKEGSEQFLRYLSQWQPEDNNSMPLQEILGKAPVALGGGIVIPVLGTVLVQDCVPAIDRAGFIQFKHQFGDRFGVQAWYLRSLGDDRAHLAYAHGNNNDIYTYDKLANVIGLGAAWRIGDKLRVSFDWGQNRTDFGRMLNGHTLYTNKIGTSDFTIDGRAAGGTPRFWVLRFDVGQSDTTRPGSWNAFADYKYFEHGSFFGGNGTEGVPDRYLDGIKSFTVGAGYVPARDFLIEAFYTFDAKGIGKRDTLYGSESFKLGDYTRIQATYKF
ncbi:TonB-dependent receptor domain-containing protein [Colibacter massiliensis]|uniref:TonB-dependent receptor domain-containing protein n=1 Tax=Colibacter massiliensis TaxID=1852379 RepID=UPI003F91A543